jgi:hypothetical protein
MVTMPVSGDVDPDIVDEIDVENSLDEGVREVVVGNVPSHEARVITKGKRIENRFIIRNSQGDLK